MHADLAETLIALVIALGWLSLLGWLIHLSL
jgi:hypothetical protein